MAAQAGLCLAGAETPEDTFCRVVAHLFSSFFFFLLHSGRVSENLREHISN